MSRTDTLNTYLHETLNAQQREAVLHDRGALLVIAGAGSGKTRIITTRITHLILHKQVASDSIVALTFTNKAALEMKERIVHYLGNKTVLPFIGTFHAYCVRFLKKYGSLIDLPVFSILDTEDQKKMITDIMKRAGTHKPTQYRAIMYQISQIKQQKNGLDLLNIPSDIYALYHQYEKEKKQAKCLDFDDLLIKTVLILESFLHIRATVQAELTHILIDEYQDTNSIQQTLLKLLANHQESAELAITSLCAVGDEDQSIYSWRGATVSHILNFNTAFKPTTIIKVEQNYRSVEPILSLANTLISHNKERTPKVLWSDRTAHDRIRLVACSSEYQESELIGNCIAALREKHPEQSIAVLYRMHAQSRAIEEILVKRSIPYTIVGGIQFYERREIKDILAYLRCINNPFDFTAFTRILNVPTRGLGQKCEDVLKNLWENEPFIDIPTSIDQCATDSHLSKTQQAAFLAFKEIFAGITPKTEPSKAIEHILSKTGYIQFIQQEYESNEAEERLNNIYELIDAAHYFERNSANTISLFLGEVGLMQEAAHNKIDDKSNIVFMMTIHAAKGLEFDTIIISGVEEGMLPTTRAQATNQDIEEERRLLYVAITRAKERLLITYTNQRYTYGNLVMQIPSRFIDEMEPYKSKINQIRYLNSEQIYSYCTQWLTGKTFHILKSSDYVYDTPQQKPHPTQTQYLRNSAVHRFKTPSSATQIRVEKKEIASLATTPLSSEKKTWYLGQPVRHATYGIGNVQMSEERSEGTFVTVRFKKGTKKIKANFIVAL